MKVKNVQPIIHSLSVTIDDLRYKGTTCLIEVECLPSSIEDKKNAKFTPISAFCQEPYFFMGGSFWEENFGKFQSKRIRKLCDMATIRFVKEYDKDEKIVKELYDILVRCETGKEYHQAIVELKIKIEKGL